MCEYLITCSISFILIAEVELPLQINLCTYIVLPESWRNNCWSFAEKGEYLSFRVRNSKNQCQLIQVFSGAIDSPKW